MTAKGAGGISRAARVSQPKRTRSFRGLVEPVQANPKHEIEAGSAENLKGKIENLVL